MNVSAVFVNKNAEKAKKVVLRVVYGAFFSSKFIPIDKYDVPRVVYSAFFSSKYSLSVDRMRRFARRLQRVFYVKIFIVGR
jgi:hypothetical protein